MILIDFPKLCLSFDKLISYPYANAVSEVSRFLLDDGSSTETMNMFLYLASRISTSDVNSCVSFRIYKQYKTLIRWREIPQSKTFLILSSLLTMSTWWRLFQKHERYLQTLLWAYLMKVIPETWAVSSNSTMSVPDEGYSRNMSGIFKLFLFYKQHHKHYSKIQIHTHTHTHRQRTW